MGKNGFNSLEMKNLKRKIAVRFPLLLVFIALLTFLPAGTFRFWQVYVYFAIILSTMVCVILYFLKNDPQFLERRIKMKEKEKPQKTIVLVTELPFLLGYFLTGLDYRFQWSHIPVTGVIIGDVLVFISYVFVVFVFKINRFASRIIEVEKDQKVICTGPYAVIRHPMYLGVTVMYLATPIALGSYWALIPFLLLPVGLVFRILNEEKILSEQLSGYKEYCKKVKYRLIPFVW